MINLSAIKPTQLKSALSSTALTARVKEFADRHGNLPTFASLNTDWFVIVVKQGDVWEQIKITNYVQETDGSCTLTIDPAGRHILPISPYTGSATGFEFGVVAEVILTNDMLTMGQFSKLGNDNAFTGYNTVPDPLSAQGIASKAYVLSVVNGGTVSFDEVTLGGTAGDTFSAGSPVYLKASDSRWYKLLANDTLLASRTNLQIGIALGAGTAGASISGGVAIQGRVSTLSGLTANSLYFVSDTGTLSVTAGTYSLPIGYATSTTTLILNTNLNAPSPLEKTALVGSQGIPSSTNKYLTQDNLYTADTDQTQTTQNATQSVGEADSTTRANIIAQSFIPTKTKIRGVTLYKGVDTGTFTGSVTVALYADSSGSPTGSALATVTITNALWKAIASSGNFDAIFTSEYASMVAGSLYWIQISTSTSDTSNHPNLGTNSAGGYSSGSVKFKNTTDSWVAIATIDLYFKTLQGISSQLSYIPSIPVTRKYETASSAIGSSTTQFDITNPAGTTFRYTFDGTGTDPSITLADFPIGSLINFQAQNFNSANKGVFVVTGAGANYVEVTNASGVAENDKTIGSGYVVKSGTTAWSKPTGLKYITVELVGSGGLGMSTGGGGGGGGGYSKETISASSLNQSEYYIVGEGTSGSGRISAFGNYLYATGGSSATDEVGGVAGIGVGGDINIKGQAGGTSGGSDTGGGGSQNRSGGNGGSSKLGGGGVGASNGVSASGAGGNYGGGGGGGADSTHTSGANGASGVIILTEYYY